MLREYIRPGARGPGFDGRSQTRVSRRRADVQGLGNPEALLHPRHPRQRSQIPQRRNPQIFGRADRRRLDIPPERLHSQRHLAAVEPAGLLRREDRRRNRRRQPRPGGLPAGAPPGIQLGLRGHLQGQEERPARQTQAQAGQRALGLRHRQEQEAHQELLGREGIPQHGGRRAHRQRHAASRAGGERHLPDRPQGAREDRGDQLPRQRTIHRQTPAPHLQENAPEIDQLLQDHETQRRGLRSRQGAADRLLQLEGIP